MGQSPSNVKKDKLEDLHEATHFDQKELRALLKQFRKESPAGVISRNEFKEAMDQMGVADPFLQEVIFKVFDQTKDGQIDFREFVTSLSVMTRGTPEEKLAFAFHMYDLDDNGYITKDELEKILSSFYRLVGPLEDSPLATFTGKKYESPQQLVDELFEEMDTDKDGRISLKEYKDGAFKNIDILQGLKIFSTTQ